MCRLAAYLNLSERVNHAVESKIDKVMTHLFYLNSFGNTDGSGVMAMNEKGHVTVHKRAVPSPDFISTKWYDGFKSQMKSYKFVAFHTRFSTVGGNSDQNSHPFRWGRYYLMQNGTATTHKNLVRGEVSPCTVDSESVCWSMHKQGVDATFENYRGAGVFMFFDTQEKTFNIVKNEERELAIVKIKDTDYFIIATESGALMYACEKFGLEIEGYLPQDITNGILHTWGVDGSYSSRELEVKKYNAFGYSQNSYAGNQKRKSKGGASNTTGKSQTSGTDNVPSTCISATASAQAVNDYLKQQREEDSAFKKFVPTVYMDELGHDVCALCGDNIEENQDRYVLEDFADYCCCTDCRTTAREEYGIKHRLSISGVY